MSTKIIHGKVRKSKLKKGINDLLDTFISEGQKVLCHTSQSKLATRLIIIHDGVRLTVKIKEDEKIK